MLTLFIKDRFGGVLNENTESAFLHNVNEIEGVVNFYRDVLGLKEGRRIKYESAGLEQVEIGNFLIIAGSERDLRFVRKTFANYEVDSLDEFKAALLAGGAKILRDIQPVPKGKNMIVRHPDGLLMEYAEYEK